MAVETNEYLSHLCRSVAGLVTTVLGEKSIPLFRRAPQVLLTAPSVNSVDYHLSLTRRVLGDDENGTFTSASDDGGITVFRNPVRIRASFLLVSPGMSPDGRLGAYDRLTEFFFDTRSLTPFVPASLERYPALAAKLRSTKAELRFSEPDGDTQWLNRSANGFSFAFDYTALYHSGNPLRTEARVQTRSLLFANEARERSIP